MSFYKYQKQAGALDEINLLLEAFFLQHREEYRELTVIPVPLHMKKCRSRGFDQAVLLAREVARIFKLSLAEGTIKRIRETPTQTRMTRNQRIENMRGAFEVQEARAIADHRILVVDDVMTTGATVGEVSRVLKIAGARRVEVLTLGRAP